MTTLIPALLLAVVQLVGGESSYVTRPGDTLKGIGARYGVDAGLIATTNGIPNPSRLEAGQIVHLVNRHIVPDSRGVQIIINIPQRMLFYYRDGLLAAYYPIGAGKPSWPTPLGSFEIATVESNPVWDVPLSIQREMAREGRPVVTKVPPGPKNPLGQHWLGLSRSGIGIHGTNAPSSVYGLPSHGCVRLHPDDIRNLFYSVQVGTRGMIVYEPVLVTRLGNSVFMEVHPDAYRIAPDPLSVLRYAAYIGGFLEFVNWDLANDVIRMQEGVAREVTLR